MFNGSYDVIVIGAGHAGCEAALASARMSAKTLLLTLSIETVALMPCNPAIGGIGKGNLVKDIDALGGEIGKNIDESGIQFRILNRSKGIAVQSTRAQADKYIYKDRMLSVLSSTDNLHLKQGIVADILVENGEVVGVEALSGERYKSKMVIITAGTFIDGEIFIGDMRLKAGRMYEPSSVHLGKSLSKLGLPVMRLKTDTPARVNIDSININGLERFSDDNKHVRFSRDSKENTLKMIDCYLTYTNEKTNKIVSDNLSKTMLYNGVAETVGPRYCPSIEDKVIKFPDKVNHNIVIEPEGLNTKECHINGLSTSLPCNIQLEVYRSIKGLESAEFTRPAYAIQYNVYDPRALDFTFQSKIVKGLYLAGQLNGTSGYEEAAAQGIVAGINAVLSLDNKTPFILGRDESYIGVLTDDIISKGIDEPYRMFTSRAEHRLALRENKAEDRLIKFGYDFGIVKKKVYDRYQAELLERIKIIDTLSKENILLSDDNQRLLSSIGINLTETITYKTLLRRPEVSFDFIKRIKKDYQNLPDILSEQIESEIKYEGYIKKQARQLLKEDEYYNITIPEEINYFNISGLRLEYANKLTEIKPKLLSDIKKISGIGASAIPVLAIAIKKIIDKKFHVKQFDGENNE